MRKLILFLLLLPTLSNAQKGIDFVHGMTWNAIVEKARIEKKYIFVDAFATWCGPCKYMAANIFTKENVGELFNNNFLNVKMQMDTSVKDNEEVKNWYAQAHEMGNDYKINVYPTFLFFNPEGKIVHRLVGSMEADVFAMKVKSLLDVENQYYSMLAKYKGGLKDADFLKKLAYATEEAYDTENMKLVGNDYLATQNNYLTEENIEFIFRFTQDSKDRGFSILLENESKLNQTKGNVAATYKLIEIITQEELNPYFKRKGNQVPDWKTINTFISKKYPKYVDEVMITGKVSYYNRQHDWTNYQVAVLQYMKQYGQKACPSQLNSFAWTLFENCKDISCLKEALDWSKRSLAEKDDPAFMDTYANLFYKLGNREEAIKWEQKALSMVGEEEQDDFKVTIAKMKKGEKTWKE
jgi:thioredoxin-related protein